VAGPTVAVEASTVEGATAVGTAVDGGKRRRPGGI